jgi:Mn2+/Fe2+ NRAMP family transporter
MIPNPDKVQLILWGVLMLGCIIFGVLFLWQKSRIANGVYYTTALVMVILFLYTGIKHLSQAAKVGVKIAWYKQRWIWTGILTFIWTIILFVSNYARNFG